MCGDEIISDVYELLQQTLDELCEKDSNVHKLLGENFIFICKAHLKGPASIAGKIRELFDSKNSRYREVGKPKEDKKKGKMPALSLAISALAVAPGEYMHYLEVLEKIKENSKKL